MNRAVSWFCKIFIGPIIKVFFIKDIKGLDNVPKTNFILATNHQSHMDELPTGYICLPRRFHFIGMTDNCSGLRKAVLYALYFVAGVIHLNRNSEESKQKAVNKAIEVLKKGDILIIYPEGTRSRTGEIGKARLGIARIFLETGVPILPAAIKGTFELMPPSGKIKTEKKVEVNIGQPLYFEPELKAAKNMNKGSEQYNKLLIKIAESLMDKIAGLKAELV